MDIGFGVNGYNTDKTQVYMFGGRPSHEVYAAHQGCMQVQSRVAELLWPGAVPSEIYGTVMNELDEGFKKRFHGI